MRRAKIVCRMGQETANDQSIEALIKSGLDVARFEFSHDDCRFRESVIRTKDNLSSGLLTHAML